MLNFCTLFDSFYLSRGLAMYDSLVKHCTDFHLYVFAFDEACLTFLKEQDFQHLTVVSLKQFEDSELLKIKKDRSRAEYCWTCTPSTILYVLNNYDVDHCTYLDSDLFFFSSPQILIDEMQDDSVLITPHRYTSKYDQSQKTGIYCVQFMTFKKNKNGLTVLNWWRDACLEWCYAKFEEGKFGDQKYLDDWPTRFEGIHVSRNLGGGVAPWNMQQYEFWSDVKQIKARELQSSKSFDVIFFHFHSLMFVSPGYFSPRPYYERNESVIKYVYNPYIKHIQQIRRRHSFIQKKESYLHGWSYFKYIMEVFVRRGVKELKYNHLLHKI